MKRLFLLRHAKSDWSTPGIEDVDRPLAPRGLKAARKIGAYMRAHDLIPRRAYCSNATRARQTWDIVADKLGTAVKTEIRTDLYMVSAKAMRAVVAKAPKSCRDLIVIGHEPAIGELARSLIDDGDAVAVDDFGRKFPTGALAVLRFDVDAWDAVRERGGYLTHFIRPRRL